MEQHTLKNVNSRWNTKITFNLETSGGPNAYLHLKVVHFFNPSVNRLLWKHKTVVLLHKCLFCVLLLLVFINLNKWFLYFFINQSFFVENIMAGTSSTVQAQNLDKR
jgi:hypothetical protein